eukprot:m.240026 g.240026  ORF g.240026 m.240026 type:complete len:347 (+) comp19406_c0_seq1:354-1394(+)
MDKYTIQGRIGEGAHGVVLRAKRIDTGTTVALKKIMIRRLEDGIPNNALREIKALQEIDEHDNIVTLRSVFSHGNGFILVFDYMHSDLSEVLRRHTLTGAQIKSYMVMLLRGVAYCHSKNIMHRDLKPANLLIDRMGRLKIADFGLARVFEAQAEDDSSMPGSGTTKRLYSHQVATRWYRAPELLYGAREYTESIDMWAVGCIMVEMINNSPLFPGENDIDQLSCVFRVLGTPTAATWPGVQRLPDFNKILFEPMPAQPLETQVANTTPSAIALLHGLLVLCPESRFKARLALLQPYFFTEPLPAHHSELPVPTGARPMQGDDDIPLHHVTGFTSTPLVHPRTLPL